MYLSSFSLVEPEDKFYFYQPSWLNAWEAHLFNKALKSTHANGWGLKRFGTQPDLYPGEMIRNPHYQKYLEAMEKAADDALMALPTKERMKLLKQRTAFIYVDSWGEYGRLRIFPARCTYQRSIRCRKTWSRNSRLTHLRSSCEARSNLSCRPSLWRTIT